MNKLGKLLFGAVVGAGAAFAYEKVKENKFKSDTFEKVLEEGSFDVDQEEYIREAIYEDVANSDSWRTQFAGDPENYAKYIITKCGFYPQEKAPEKVEPENNEDATTGAIV